MEFINDVVWPGLVAGSLYALTALGINVVGRVTKVVNFAYAGFVLWAPLGVLLLVRQHGVPVPLAFVLATIGVVAIALIEERIAIRPFLRRSTAMPWRSGATTRSTGSSHGSALALPASWSSPSTAASPATKS